MPLNLEETRPYNPGLIVIKLVNVPEALKKDAKVLDAFTNLIEKRAKCAGNFTSGNHLHVSEHTAGVPFYQTEDGNEEFIDIDVPEVKDKGTTRLLRKITQMCFIGRNPAEVKTNGFDLLAYELSEDQNTVIDAWKLSGFTFPNGLGISSEYSAEATYKPDAVASIKVPAVSKDNEFFGLTLTGTISRSDKVLIQAMKQFKFQLEKAGQNTDVLDADLLEAQGGGEKDA